MSLSKTEIAKLWPDNPKEFREFVCLRALAMRVLAVAQTRIEGTWCAYIDAVPGARHREEYAAVLRHGDKLDEEVAAALFPWLASLGVPYAR